MFCPNGHGQKPGKFCDRCGADLVSETPSNPDQPYEIFGDQACPGCGYELDHDHQQFCPGCGHHLKWLCR